LRGEGLILRPYAERCNRISGCKGRRRRRKRKRRRRRRRKRIGM